MRKIVTTAILCAGLAGFTACSDFLDEEPKSALTLETYYQTESDIIGNVNYLYRNGVPSLLSDMSGAYRGSSVSVTSMLTGYFQSEYNRALQAQRTKDCRKGCNGCFDNGRSKCCLC